MLLSVERVTKTYGGARQRLVALDDVTLRVDQGERVGLIGASGAGKSTLARLVAGLENPDRGRVWLEGKELTALGPRGRRAAGLRRHLVFQDPYAALPRGRRVGDIVAEPLVIHRVAGGDALTERVRQALQDVALVPPDRFLGRRPPQLSGGERQRVALARAIIGRPALILADEPTSMLDAPVRTDLLATLSRLGARHGTAVLSITHDLALAAAFCERLVVLHRGTVVEEGPSHEVLTRPCHPWTVTLRSAALELRGAAPQPS